MIQLYVLADGLANDPDSTGYWWLKTNILGQAGVGEQEFELSEGVGAPLLLMCKEVKVDRLLPEYLSKKKISDYAGHIEKKNGRWIGCTFHPDSVRSNPNLLPLCIRHCSNLLGVARNSSLYLEW